MINFVKKLWGLIRPYSTRFYLGILTGVLAGVMEPLTLAAINLVSRLMFPSAKSTPISDHLSWAPKFVQEWANHLPGPEGQAQTGVIFILILMIPLVLLLRGAFGYLNNYLLQWAAMRAITDLNVRLFRHVLRLPVSFFAGTNSGELMSRIMYDTYTLKNVMSNSAAVIIKDPIIVIGSLSLLMWQQPRLTLISMIALPACIVPVVVYSRKVRRASKALQESTAEMTVVMAETFTSTRVVKAFNLENKMAQTFSEAARRNLSQYMRIIRAGELPGPLLEFFGGIGVSLVLLYLALYDHSEYKAANFTTMILALFSIYKPLKNLSKLNSNLEQARAASNRVFEILGTESDIVEPSSPKPIYAAKAPIAFNGVSFSFGEKTVLSEIDLVVQPGQLVALVGESGSGKTTLTNLLLRFYDPSVGRIQIGGVDIREALTSELRSQIAVVTQETILFHDTIANNIELGHVGATRAEIENAARQAHAHEFIMEKPDGYDTVVGEKGSALSGGQRQRIAIARAILKGAPILILDEATNALDTASENAVQEALAELMRGRTSIVIAHRLSTVQHADVIIVMKEGRIVERGTHEELLKLEGTYSNLHQLQFRTQA